jgi:Bacterial dnaA protein helix-turn-helix
MTMPQSQPTFQAFEYSECAALPAASCFDSSTPSKGRQMRLAIELAVTRVFGVDQHLIEHGSRGVARVALARQVAMYLAHVGCGLSMTASGQLFGRDRTTVAHACLIIEDRRDDPLFDRALDLLEWAVPVMVLRPGPYLAPYLAPHLATS